MALFGRRNKTSVPAEIQEYYQSERRERAGVAWLLAFGTLLVTVVLATGIFFAGRWAYRTVFNGDEEAPTEVAQQDQEPERAPEPPAVTTPSEEDRRAEEERQAEENRQREEAEKKAEEEAAAKKRAEEEADRQEAEKKQEEQAAREQESQEQSGGSRQVAGTSNIPDTGPGDVAAIFAGTSILGYLVHRLYTRKSFK